MSKNDGWMFYKDVDFTNETYSRFSLDTRDFHCSMIEKEKPLDISIIRKYPKRFFHTATEVVNLLDRYYEQSGGKNNWRFFSLKTSDGRMQNWNMKYIRINRTIYGFIICDDRDLILNKEILSCDVNTELLSAH